MAKNVQSVLFELAVGNHGYHRERYGTRYSAGDGIIERWEQLVKNAASKEMGKKLTIWNQSSKPVERRSKRGHKSKERGVRKELYN